MLRLHVDGQVSFSEVAVGISDRGFKGVVAFLLEHTPDDSVNTGSELLGEVEIIPL